MLADLIDDRIFTIGPLLLKWRQWRSWGFQLTTLRLQVLCSTPLPDITGRTALAVRPDVLNAKHHVITNATYSCLNHDSVPAKFKHVTNIETCTLLCCDHFTLWKAVDANMVENGARCSDKNNSNSSRTRQNINFS